MLTSKDGQGRSYKHPAQREELSSPRAADTSFLTAIKPRTRKVIPATHGQNANVDVMKTCSSWPRQIDAA